MSEPKTHDSAPGKLAAQVATVIEADVMERGWPVGLLLGTENELRARYGVSRSVLREAVRLVEHHQVATMRRGPGGGLFVTAPNAQPAVGAMTVYLEYAGLTGDELVRARRLLEPLALGLAAARLTEPDVLRLRERAALAQSEPLHTELGRLSGNAALDLFVNALVDLTARHLDPRGVVPGGGADNAAIVDAVVAGRPGEGELGIASYLDALAATISADGTGERRMEVQLNPAMKRSVVIAAELTDQIAEAGWPTGTVLASQEELLERFGVSRVVLREAVRLLEHHHVARMRPGPGGGLVVGAPGERATVEVMALYLQYQKVSSSELIAVRAPVELGIMADVGKRLDAPATVAAIRATLATEPADRDGARDFHDVLAAESGNRALAFFYRILGELWWRRAGVVGPDVATATARAHADHLHIGAALFAGDPILAAYRMRAHLDQLRGRWH